MAEVEYGSPRMGGTNTSLRNNTQIAGLAAEALASRHRGYGKDELTRRTWPEGGQLDFQPDVLWPAAEQETLQRREMWDQFARQTRRLQGSYGAAAEVSWSQTPNFTSDQYLQFLMAGQDVEFLTPLIARIRLLMDMAAEDEDQRALRTDSLVGFFRFLYVHKDRINEPPQLVLTMAGYLRAEWRRSRDCRVAVRFVDRNTISFVTFLPDRHVPAQINRVGGDSSISGFFENTGIAALPRPK